MIARSKFKVIASAAIAAMLLIIGAGLTLPLINSEHALFSEEENKALETLPPISGFTSMVSSASNSSNTEHSSDSSNFFDSALQLEENFSEKELPSINLSEKTLEEKIHPELLNELNELIETNSNEKVDVLFVVESEEDLIKLKELVGEDLSDSFEFGGIISLSVSAEKALELTENNFVESAWPDLPLSAALPESIEQINLMKVFDSGFTGKGVKVAVIDSGINEEHKFLQGRVSKSINFSDSLNTFDKFGHGTHIAGIIAGSKVIESGLEFSGVASEAELFNVKVLNEKGQGSTLSVLKGIEWAVENKAGRFIIRWMDLQKMQ